MKSIQRPLLYLTFIVFWACAGILAAQTNTPTQTNSPTNSSTPNATLTPPCASIGSFGNKTPNSVLANATNQMRASLYPLNAAATVYTVWMYCSGFALNSQVAVALYDDASPAGIGSFIVQSAPQTVVTGWNGFTVPATYLTAKNYWLAYMYNSTGYSVNYTSSAAVSNALYVSSGITFGTFPSSPASPNYISSNDGIYASYCLAPTNTPTVTNTPTDTKTFTQTFTPTNTGTILVNTNSFTPTATFSFTPTPSMTFTWTSTPNASLTPVCGGPFTYFGDTNTCCGPVTSISDWSMRTCRYTLSQSGTIQTMSLYLPNQDNGQFWVETAIYSNDQSSTMVGNLLAQSTTQVSTAGWNVFQVPSTPVTAGDYWLAYIYGGPVSAFALQEHSSPPAGNDLPLGNSLAYLAVSSFTFPSSGTVIPSTQYAVTLYDPIIANYCPGVVYTNTPTNSPTITPTLSSTPTITPLPCGASAAFFGSTNISGASVTLQSVELLSYQNSLPVDSTVYSISLYATAYDANDLAEVGLYSSQGTTMGTLIASSGSTPQTLTAGWNNFSLPAAPVTAGNYWLTYLFQAPVSYSIVYQTPTPGGPNSLAYDLDVPSSVFPTNAATWGPDLAYTNTILGPIIANYCPGTVNTNTPTNSPTITSSFTPTATLTNTGTSTLSFTPTNTGTPTDSPTITWTGTDTNSPTITYTPTFSNTPSFTGTDTATSDATFTATYSPTPTPTLSPTNSPSDSPTSTPTSSPTNTPANSLTATSSSTDSPSSTPTATPSDTPTSSPTLSPSSTASSSPTSTPSNSPTLTGSPTYSATPSPTSTVSFTSTPTITFTATSTSTPTPGADISKTSSESTANINDLITYTITLNVGAGSVTNVVVTDVLPSALSFVGFGSTPSGAVTYAWNSATQTLSWSFGNLGPGTYLISYQAKVVSDSQTSTITNHAQLSYDGLITPKTASVNVILGNPAPVFYPNPIKGDGPAILQMVFPTIQDFVNIKIFTTAFRKVFEDRVLSVPAGTFRYNLDSSNFKGGRGANGLYYLVVTTPSDHWVIKLLITR